LKPEIEEYQSRSELIEVARQCYAKGYICGLEGNFSIRLAENLVLTTPRGVCKARLHQDELVLTDMSGKSVSGGEPSTELKMHLVAYEKRPDIRAVLHAHPVTAVGLTVAGISLLTPILPEVVCTLGGIPTAPYATPSTDEIPESIAALVVDYDALMLDHHGALLLGSDLWDAFYKLETVEHFAQTLMVAYQVGRPIELTTEQVARLNRIKSIYKKSDPAELLISKGSGKGEQK
jgi:L-fuculose-phosphate aldolase